MCSASGLTLDKVQQYYLNHTLVTSYLGSLYEEGRLKPSFKDNVIHWARA